MIMLRTAGFGICTEAVLVIVLSLHINAGFGMHANIISVLSLCCNSPITI